MQAAPAVAPEKRLGAAPSRIVAERAVLTPVNPVSSVPHNTLGATSVAGAFSDRRVSMIERLNTRPASVVGPHGERLTMEALPAPDTSRWVVRRKAEVVAAVNGGMLSLEEACKRYQLTLEEFASWQRAVERSGLPGLRVTRAQHYRDLYQRSQRF
jgi:hypothetical protein